MDELDALGGHAAAEQARLHCVDVRGAELGELDVADGRGDVQGDDGAVAPGGGLPAMRDDDVLEPAVEPLADGDLLGWKVDAPVEGGEQPAELALGGGLRSLNGDELAAPFAEGVAAQVDRELVGARCPLPDGALHLLADNPVFVPIIHVLIGWVMTTYWNDLMALGLGARDSPIVVVVVGHQGIKQ